MRFQGSTLTYSNYQLVWTRDYGHTYQMMQAFAAANGGQMQKLRLVDHLTDPDTGKETPNPTTVLGNLSPETYEETLLIFYIAKLPR